MKLSTLRVKILILRLTVCGVSLVTLKPAQAIELYTMTEPCDLVQVDTNTGTQTTVGNLGLSVEGLAFNNSGELYASVQPGFCGAHGSATHLARIDPSTAAVQIIGAFGFSDVNAIAFRPDGTLFGASAGSDKLFEVDLVTGAGTPIGSIGFPFVGGLEFLSNELLVGSGVFHPGGGSNTFASIDPATGMGMTIGTFNFDTIAGLTLGSDGVLYGLSDTAGGGAGAIISVDPTTGAGTFVQSVQSPRFRAALAARKQFPEVPTPTAVLHFGIAGILSALRRQRQRQ